MYSMVQPLEGQVKELPAATQGMMGIIRSCWVLPPRTVIEFQLWASQLSQVAINLLSAQPMPAVEHVTS